MKRVILVKPGKRPEVIESPLELSDIQTLVNGYMEVIAPFNDSVCLICDEEGKIDGAKPNRVVRNEKSGKVLDIIYGPFLIVGDEGEDFGSLNATQIAKYMDMFHDIEFAREE